MKRTHTCIAACLLTASGCMMWDPGGQVRQAMTQENRLGWAETGAFTAEGIGTQTFRITMIEGDLVMKEGPDGKPVPDLPKCRITSYLATDPKADQAANALLIAAQESTSQMRILAEALRDTLATFTEYLTKAPPP
jgi:hypothetical protein